MKRKLKSPTKKAKPTALPDPSVVRTGAQGRQLPPEAFDRIPRVQVTLTDETAWLTRFDPKGCPALTYPIAIEDAASAFSTLGATTGLLPIDTLFWTERAGKHRIGIYLPPQKRELHFDTGTRQTVLHVPLPGFVFVGEGIHYFIFAVTERPLPNDKMTETLYKRPCRTSTTADGSAQAPSNFPPVHRTPFMRRRNYFSRAGSTTISPTASSAVPAR
jgi:hypothetical protein